MNKVWIVAANAVRGRLFTARGGVVNPELTELEALVHPESRVHEQELSTDQPGRQASGYGGGKRHGVSDRTSPKEVEHTAFAREIAQRLERGREAGEYEALYLVAEPEFLGHLRKAVDEVTARRVRGEIAKNLASAEPDKLRQHLPAKL